MELQTWLDTITDRQKKRGKHHKHVVNIFTFGCAKIKKPLLLCENTATQSAVIVEGVMNAFGNRAKFVFPDSRSGKLELIARGVIAAWADPPNLYWISDQLIGVPGNSLTVDITKGLSKWQ